MMRQILLCLFILFACSASAELFKITGTVVDSHEPLIGAHVQIKGTERFTFTDFDGNFSIEVEKGAILEISCVGCNSKEVEVMDDSFLLVELVPKGEDIVVVGCTHCFDPPIPKLILPPIPKLNSLNFSLPESPTDDPTAIVR